MKGFTIKFQSIALVCACLVASQLQAADAIPLHEAVKDGKVSATVTGLGGSTGDAIQIKVQRRVKDVLHLTLATGTVFRNDSGKAQNMAGATIKGESITDTTYRPLSEIVLLDDAEHAYVVEAY